MDYDRLKNFPVVETNIKLKDKHESSIASEKNVFISDQGYLKEQT